MSRCRCRCVFRIVLYINPSLFERTSSRGSIIGTSLPFPSVNSQLHEFGLVTKLDPDLSQLGEVPSSGARLCSLQLSL